MKSLWWNIYVKILFSIFLRRRNRGHLSVLQFMESIPWVVLINVWEPDKIIRDKIVEKVKFIANNSHPGMFSTDLFPFMCRDFLWPTSIPLFTLLYSLPNF